MFQVNMIFQLCFIVESLTADFTNVIFLFGMTDGNMVDLVCVGS